MEEITGNKGIGDGCINPQGKAGSSELLEIMYFHGTTIDGNRFTIAGVVEDDDLLLGVAICANGEQFIKEKGRTIASGRVLNQRKYPRGRRVKSLYALPAESQFANENGMFTQNYFKGIEIKVFRDQVCEYNYCTKKELLQDFSLFKPQE